MPAAADAFAGNALDTRWQVLRPVAAGLDVADGRLWLRPYAGQRNVVLQPAPAGPWTMTTAVDAGGAAGLVLWREDRPADLVTVASAGGARHLRIVSDGARPATFTGLRSEDGGDVGGGRRAVPGRRDGPAARGRRGARAARARPRWASRGST